jgi:hypothetical protein
MMSAFLILLMTLWLLCHAPAIAAAVNGNNQQIDGFQEPRSAHWYRDAWFMPSYYPIRAAVSVDSHARRGHARENISRHGCTQACGACKYTNDDAKVLVCAHTHGGFVKRYNPQHRETTAMARGAMSATKSAKTRT